MTPSRRGAMRYHPGMRAAVLAFLAGCAAAQAPAPAAPAAPSRDAALALIEASPDLDGAVVGPAGAPATIAVVFASWCSHCRHAFGVLGRALAAAPDTRAVGVNYRGHEEYDGRGSAAAVRAYVAAHAPWLRVVPAGEPLFAALGRPPLVPTIYVYDRAGALVARYDRRDRELPGEDELAGLLRELARRGR